MISEKHQIIKSLIEAMRNYPPSKKDMDAILDKVKKEFPNFKALKEPMKKLPGIIPIPWLEIGVKYDLFKTVEKRLNVKPFNPERAKDAFANLLWLITILFFMDDLQDMIKE